MNTIRDTKKHMKIKLNCQLNREKPQLKIKEIYFLHSNWWFYFFSLRKSKSFDFGLKISFFHYYFYWCFCSLQLSQPHQPTKFISNRSQSGRWGNTLLSTENRQHATQVHSKLWIVIQDFQQIVMWTRPRLAIWLQFIFFASQIQSSAFRPNLNLNRNN